MIAEALKALNNHIEEKLWPFPDKMPWLEGKNIDFWSEVCILETNIQIALRELRDNETSLHTQEEIKRYADRAIEILQSARSQVNQYFRDSNPAYVNYNATLQQIEAEGVTEEPNSGFEITDSISEDKLQFPAEKVALYLNKLCLWAIHIFQQYFVTGAEFKTTAAPSKLSFVCQNNQVYYLFRWLKTHGWVSNTNDEIINFMINHISFKGDTPTYSTIRAELTRNAELPETKKFIPPQD